MGFERPRAEKTEFSPEEIRELFHGVWAEELYNSQELPVGRSLAGDELTTKLRLDFENFDDELNGYTEENMRSVFESGENRKLYEEYLEAYGVKIDSYLHFVCFQIQNKVARLLEIDPVERPDFIAWMQKYNDRTPNLSEMKGLSRCGERAALAQYLLQRLGIESAYVGGVSSISGEVADVEDHSFIVLKNRDGQSLIFDIARPHDGNNAPSIYETDEQFDYELLAGKEELLIGGTEILNKNRAFFGVADTGIAR